MFAAFCLCLLTLGSAQRLRVRGAGGDVLFDRNGDDSVLSSIKQGADGTLIVSSDMEVSGSRVSGLVSALEAAQSALGDAEADIAALRSDLTTAESAIAAAEGTILDLINEMTVAKSNIVVLHSTSASAPTLPGATKLWEGYSFAGFMLQSSGGFHDLTQPSSCLPEFRMNAVYECSGTTNCELVTSGDFTLWMAIENTVTLSVNTLPADLSKVSRCAVFDAPFPVVAKHAASNTVPSPPAGWSTVHTGYSLVGLKAGGADVGQSGAPMACLPSFSPMPFLECNGASCQSNTGDDVAGWLYGGTATNTGSVSGTTLRTTVGRCAVFKKNVP